MVAGGNCCCCTRGCKVCNNETVTNDSPSWQAIVDFEPNPDYGFPPNPFETCDCDATPFISWCCDHLDKDALPLVICGSGGPVNCGGFDYFYEYQDEYGAYLDGWYQIEAIAGGGTCEDAPTCCLWGYYLEMECTDSSDNYHDFGTWYALCFGFIKLYTDADNWTLGAALYMPQVYSGKSFYQYIDLGTQKIDCTDASFTFDSLLTTDGATNLGYCQPISVVIERV